MRQYKDALLFILIDSMGILTYDTYRTQISEFEVCQWINHGIFLENFPRKIKQFFEFF